MEKPTLKYTATRIARAEEKYHKNFFGSLGEISMSNLLFLFCAGGGTEDEFDELFKDGADVLMELIMDGLEAGGFLDSGAVAEAKDAIKQLTASKETSRSSGAATKK